jgi:hypothetical protein
MSVERILLTRGLPSGAVHGVREAVLMSESLGLGGFRHLLEKPDGLDWNLFADIRTRDLDDGALAIDGGGIHVWLALPTIMDLAVAQARRAGSSVTRVSNVAALQELGVAQALGRRYGAVASVAGGAISVKNSSRPVSAEQWDPLLWHAMRHGYDVEEALWRDLHRLSNSALAADSVVSRRHAGPVVLQDDGSIKGRVPGDDDFDMNMLKKVAP